MDGWILRANSAKNLMVTWKKICCLGACDSSHDFAGDSGSLGRKLVCCRRNGGRLERLCGVDEEKTEVRVAAMTEFCSKVEIVNQK